MKKKMILIVTAVLLVCVLTVTISVLASENKAPAATEEPLSDQPAENTDSTEKIVSEEQTFVIPAPELLSKVTEAGTEVIGAETLAKLRVVLDSAGTDLTLEKATQISEAVQKLYEGSETTFILNSFTLPNSNVAKWSEPVVLQKPSTEGMKMGSEELAGARYWQIEQINQMIVYSLIALSPSDNVLPQSVFMTYDEMCVLNFGAYLYTDYILLGGEYDSLAEAIELVRASSDHIAYIKCTGQRAYYHCGDTCIELTLNPWSSEEYLAHLGEFEKTDEYRQMLEEYERLHGN